jgi:demethylmenaquinone methyltransferase/2-methoxy-6-polyprenyl-1,4-benzoquinol methylase
MTDYTGPEPTRIRAMFASIAGRYDRANTVMSGGIHHLWRRRAVRWSGAKPGDRVLDCATGTGDLAIAFRQAVLPGGEVIGTDFVPEMLDQARLKAPELVFDVADVTALPYEDASFDIASISFGIRNVGDPGKGIRELWRVVRPGGCVLILEFGQPHSRLFGAMYSFYRKLLLPRLGGLVTGERSAYDYLETSSAKFPCGDDFVALMRENGTFESVEYRSLSLGIAYLYKGVKSRS